MGEKVRVVLDAMGGDNAPGEIVKGAVDAVNEAKDIQVILVGQEEKVNAVLEGLTYPKEQITVVNATEVIEMAEPPVAAIRKKKDSSIVVGMKLVKDDGVRQNRSMGAENRVEWTYEREI